MYPKAKKKYFEGLSFDVFDRIQYANLINGFGGCELIDTSKPSRSESKVLVINFLYSEYLCRSTVNHSYKSFLNSSSLNLIDGKGLAFSLKTVWELDDWVNKKSKNPKIQFQQKNHIQSQELGSVQIGTVLEESVLESPEKVAHSETKIDWQSKSKLPKSKLLKSNSPKLNSQTGFIFSDVALPFFYFIAQFSKFPLFGLLGFLVFAPSLFVYTVMLFWYGVLRWERFAKDSPFQVFLGRSFVDNALKKLNQTAGNSCFDKHKVDGTVFEKNTNEKNVKPENLDSSNLENLISESPSLENTSLSDLSLDGLSLVNTDQKSLNDNLKVENNIWENNTQKKVDSLSDKKQQKIVWIIAAGSKNNLAKNNSTKTNPTKTNSSQQSNEIDNSKYESKYELGSLDNFELRQNLKKMYPNICFEYLFFDKDGDFMRENWSDFRSVDNLNTSIYPKNMTSKASKTLPKIFSQFQFIEDFRLFDHFDFAKTKESYILKDFLDQKINTHELPYLVLVALGGASGKQEYAIKLIKEAFENFLSANLPKKHKISNQQKNIKKSLNTSQNIPENSLKKHANPIFQIKDSHQSQLQQGVKNIVVSGIGAALDRFGAGKKQILVPAWVQNLGLESFFRWFTNPKRFLRVFYAMLWTYLWVYTQFWKILSR